MAKATTEPTTKENWRIQDVNTWPGAFGIYKYSKQAVKLNIGSLIILTLISIIASYSTYIFELIPGATGTMIGNLVSTVASIFVGIALVTVLLDSIRGKKSDAIEALKNSTKYFVKYFLASVLVVVIILASLLALIVPFFFIAPRMANVFYFLIDKDMAVTDAVQASWDSTQSNVGKVYGILGVYILIALLAITIVGIPFAIWFGIMYYAASAVYYEYTKKNTVTASKTIKAKK